MIKISTPSILFLMLCFQNFSTAQTTTGLIGYFNFNSNLTNTGSAAITATTYNTSYTTNNPNVAGQAIQYAGNLNSYTELTDNGNLDFTGSTNFTISFGFLFSGSASGGIIDNCINYNGWGVWVWSTVSGVWNLQFNYKGNSVGSAAATAITYGTWQHITAVRNNGTISIYINGVLKLSTTEGTQTPSYPISPALGAMTYATYTPPRYNPLSGKIDELRIYNRALSDVEIAALTPYALPLKLGYFNALLRNDGNELQWETITEYNTAYFEVQQSINNTDWSTIGTIAAKGNSTNRNTYRLKDIPRQNETVFYRLKMVDTDGAFTYSHQIVVKQKKHDFILDVFPNPATHHIQLSYAATDKTDATLQIIDAHGRILKHQKWNLQVGNNSTNMPVNDLPAGVYVVKLIGLHVNEHKTFLKK